MVSPSQPGNDWENTTKSSLVSIGTHNLFLTASGPPRCPDEPLVIVFSGAGDVTASWVAVERLVSTFSRILRYDRSGLGQSESHPEQCPASHLATSAAEELDLALQATRIAAPYVLCAHSYGAIVAREFLHRRPNDVVGVVLADPSTERQCHFFRVPDPNIIAVTGDLNFARVTGLRDDAKLSSEGWRSRAAQIARGAAATEEEGRAFVEVCETLAEKKQLEKQVLGAKPLSVIRCNSRRDFERIYEAGVRAENGTDKQRRAFRELLDPWEEVDKELKEEQLRLSCNSRIVHLPDSGHNVQLVRPDIVADEIRWVLGNIGSSRESNL
jgi:pimeloyl-ACP methyl ester carboxylesterase